MKRIDFLGAPGVGKTTLYKELTKQRTKPYKFLTSEEAKIEVAKEYLQENKNINNRFLKSLALNSKVFKKQQCFLANNILKNCNKIFPWKEEYSDGLNSVIHGISQSNFPPEIKLLRYSFLLRKTNEVALIERFTRNDVFVVFEESITHKMIPAGPWDSSEEKKDLEKICKLIENVDYIVLLFADIKTIMERLKNRRKVRPNSAHVKMSKEELEEETMMRLRAADQMTNELEKQGKRIIRINTKKSTNDQMNILKKEIPFLF